MVTPGAEPGCWQPFPKDPSHQVQAVPPPVVLVLGLLLVRSLAWPLLRSCPRVRVQRPTRSQAIHQRPPRRRQYQSWRLLLCRPVSVPACAPPSRPPQGPPRTAAHARRLLPRTRSPQGTRSAKVAAARWRAVGLLRARRCLCRPRLWAAHRHTRARRHSLPPWASSRQTRWPRG